MITSPLALFVVVAVGLVYAMGRDRWSQRAGRQMVPGWYVGSFFGGLIAIAVALASPLDTAADTSLAAHMTQHVLLLSVAGPLLALGMPIPTLFWALPTRLRRRATSVSRRFARAHDRRFATWVAAALIGEALVMWAWHIPPAYQAAIRHPPMHLFEHACFLLVSTFAWWTVANGRRSRRGAAAIAALLGSLPGMALGLAMVLAPNPWYPIYITGTRAAALADQQIAGVIMWAFGGMAAVIAGAALFASWLAAGDPGVNPRIVPVAVESGMAS